jgi:hypothetical protein
MTQQAEAAPKLVASSTSPPVLQQPAAPPPAPEPPARQLPPLQLVNSTLLTMEYGLEKVGPSGIGTVDLYVTEDDGRTWQRFAEDPDAKGLVQGGKVQRTIELPHEGQYGFRLVVRSRVGLGDTPPMPGDLPEMRVEVDTTAPEAHLWAAPDPNRKESLVLTWDCKDRNLAQNPVTLEWAERRDGPWHVIADHLPSAPSGHSWQLSAVQNLPVYVFLRLRVRDTAGNEGQAVSSEPQLTDLTRPVGHLLSVSAAVRAQ